MISAIFVLDFWLFKHVEADACRIRPLTSRFSEQNAGGRFDVADGNIAPVRLTYVPTG